MSVLELVGKWDQRMERRTASLLVLTTVGASAAGSARPRARTLEGGWARTWGRPSGYMKARGTARASERPWVRNSVRACVVAVVRCFVRPSRVAALSRRQRSFWGVPRRRRRDAIDAKPTEHALDAIDTSRHRRGRPVGGRLPKTRDAEWARGLEGGVHRGGVGGIRRGTRRRRRRRLGRRRRRGLVRWVDPARAFMLLSRRRRSCSLGGGAATPSTPSTREGSQKTKDAVIGRRLERRVDRRTV